MTDEINNINRDEQFEQVEGLFTWYDEIVSTYEAAFWVHYRILNKHIETWMAAINDEDIMPRVLYFVNTEYMSMVFTELLLNLEVLFKAELVRAGFSKQDLRNVSHGGHGLADLLDKMENAKDDRCKQIGKMFDNCIDIIKRADDKKAFINARYIDWEKYQPDMDSASEIKKIVKALDNVYKGYYGSFDIEHLLYLGMEVGFGESNFTNDEERRLTNCGLL